MLCLNVAEVVAQESWEGQTAQLNSVPVFTPTESGLYRVNVYAETNVSSSFADYFYATFTSVDDFGNPWNGGIQAVFDHGNPDQVYGGVFCARLTAGNALNVSTQGSGSTFNLYVAVERIA